MAQGRYGCRPLPRGSLSIPRLAREAHEALDGMHSAVDKAVTGVRKGNKDQALAAIDQIVERVVEVRRALEKIEGYQ